jgi:signal transduction histidine kinase/ligand-binding sensor domain-containing protein
MAMCPCGFALNPALDVSQYAHTSWKIRDGFPKGQVVSIAQTPDGYLWLGSEFGLFRFDGVRAVVWQPPASQHLPSSYIFSLLAARDGTLWIGTLKGLASWKNDRLTHYPELAERVIFKVLEDREGTVWASSVDVTTGRLCAIREGVAHCYGDDGALGPGAFNLYEDSKGNLWAGVKGGLWRWKPGPPKFYPLDGEPDGIQGLGEDNDGALLVGYNGGLRRLVGVRTEACILPGAVGQFRALRLLRDRDGSLWIGTSDRGLLHVHQGRTDVFAPTGGLSSEHVYTISEDREGSIWMSTPNGLDRFRDFAVATLTVSQGLSNANVVSVLAAKDGSVWLATRGGLSSWMHGQIMNYGQHRIQFVTGKGERAQNLNRLMPHALYQDERGRIWVSTLNGFGYLENDRFIPVRDVPGGPVNAIAQDSAGSLWVANEWSGLFQLRGASVVQQTPWSRIGRMEHASASAADPSQGVWLGFHLGDIAHFSGGEVRIRYRAADGLGKGRVNHLRFDGGNALWVATDGGLSRLKNGRLATLTTRNGLPCDTVHWTMEDNDGSVWLYTACGLVRIARAELDAWAAADAGAGPKRKIQTTVFDASDGVRILALAGHFGGQVAKSKDGRIWFLPWDGASVVDPRHLALNKVPPPVHIEEITANGKTYDPAAAGKRLPPLIRDLEIDYTALSLAAPEKVRFRYLLEGYDRDWQDAGPRRQAFYTNLPPRDYRFRVIACNNSGVWNKAGASFDFSIAPAYYQSTWFRASCVAAFLALLGALYWLRLQYVRRQFNIRLEERVNERTRIARDLHDTLLQSFQGVLLRFHAVTFKLPDRSEARADLEDVIEAARQAITEGRDAVQGLRSSTVISNDLARSIGSLAEELAEEQPDGKRPQFRMQVEGKTRDLPPLVRDEVYRIASEATRNAFRHASARRIEVDIVYGKRHFGLRLRDDGKGVDQHVLDEGGRTGHHGLPGMHERARLVGGKLAVWSDRGSGTEIELTIPAVLAYANAAAARESSASAKES